MRSQPWLLVVILSATALGGCQSATGEDCVSLGSPAIVAHVTDAPTGLVPTSGVTLIIRGTAYDSVTTMSFGGDIQAGNAPGTYTAIVRQNGHREFSQDGVKVASASCNQPVTVRLNVVLQAQ